jgi:hypothetical protein
MAQKMPYTLAYVNKKRIVKRPCFSNSLASSALYPSAQIGP